MIPYFFICPTTIGQKAFFVKDIVLGTMWIRGYSSEQDIHGPCLLKTYINSSSIISVSMCVLVFLDYYNKISGSVS